MTTHRPEPTGSRARLRPRPPITSRRRTSIPTTWTTRSSRPIPSRAVEHELHRKSLGRRLAEALISLAALVVLFALVIPKVSGATYRQVAHQLHRLSIAEIALLTVVWLVGLVAYAGVLTASLPGSATHPGRSC